MPKAGGNGYVKREGRIFLRRQGAIDGYRNNTSFTCGYDEAGRDAVGFMKGLYKVRCPLAF